VTWSINADHSLAQMNFATARVPAEDGARQHATVRAIIERLGSQAGVILADEVGMGKTFVALGVAVMAALADSRKRPIVVMVPAGLVDKWARDFTVFRDLVLPATDRNVITAGVARNALDLFRLFGDRNTRLIFLRHGAFHLHGIDAWTRLALIQRASKGIHLGPRRDRLPRWTAHLVMNRSKAYDEDLYRKLLQTHSSGWRQIVERHTGENEGLPENLVPPAVQEVLDSDDFDVTALGDALRELPLNQTETLERRLDELRTTINAELRMLWPALIRRVSFKSPLLILDEAHHLKNPATRLASLFIDPDHEEEMRAVDGALHGVFERMLLLTATPFQLGHHELIQVLRRFGSIDWKTLSDSSAAEFRKELDTLQETLDTAQRQANDLDRHWQRLRLEDLGGRSPDDWWSSLDASDVSVPERVQEVLATFRMTQDKMRAAQGALSKWVIRHQRSRHLPNSSVGRRLRHVGAAIVGPAEGSHGLRVEGEALLPFLLAARAQAIEARARSQQRRALFAEGLASSYEAFRETRTGKIALDEQAVDEDTVRVVDGRVKRYLKHLDAALPSGAHSARHPKIAAVTRRVVALWQQGEKVVVFCHFRKTGNALVRHISNAIEEALWAEAERRSGLSRVEAEDLVRRIGDRFDDGPLSGALKETVEALASAYESLSVQDVVAITTIIKRFLRTPMFVARYFDLAADTHSKGSTALRNALSKADSSGQTLRDKIEAFVGFVAQRTGGEGVATQEATEREDYLTALETIMSGARDDRSRTTDHAVDDSGQSLLPTVRLINGKTKADSRHRLMLSFNTPFFPEVLVASEVMAEGVDLHLGCRYMIHHDLDWNPSTIEQRTGRIDRLGAKAETVGRPIEVYLPYIAATQDEKQFRVVTDRERWFQVLMGEKYQTDEASTERLAERVALPEAAAEVLRYQLSVYPPQPSGSTIKP
jgi:superfamily II DNA or RNA helicase